MVQFKNVKATVIRYTDKKPYHEYKLTKIGTRRGQTVKEAYVEVVPGERFAVVVDIGIAFEFRGGDDAQITCSFDGSKPTFFYVSRKNVTDTYTAASLSWRRRTWEHVSEKVGSRWTKRQLVFTELQHDDIAGATEEHVTAEANPRGMITVEIQCGTLGRVEPRPREENRISEAASASTGKVSTSEAPSTLKPRKWEEGVPGDHTWTEHNFTAAKSRFCPPLRLNLIYRTRGALEQLKIIPRNPLAPNPFSSPSTTSGRAAVTSTSHESPDLPHDVGGTAGQPPPEQENAPEVPLDIGINDESAPPLDLRAPNSPLHTGNNVEQPLPKKQRIQDPALIFDHDAEQPQPKKAKNEMNSDSTVLSSGVKGERQLPQIKSEKESKHKVQMLASNIPAAPPSADHTPVKPSPIVIKDEDEDEDIVIVSAGPAPCVQPTSIPAQAQVSATPGQHESQAKRERKKAILKKRLEQLKIEQELLEMED